MASPQHYKAVERMVEVVRQHHPAPVHWAHILGVKRSGGARELRWAVAKGLLTEGPRFHYTLGLRAPQPNCSAQERAE